MPTKITPTLCFAILALAHLRLAYLHRKTFPKFTPVGPPGTVGPASGPTGGPTAALGEERASLQERDENEKNLQENDEKSTARAQIFLNKIF